jgi:hypothetical protein
MEIEESTSNISFVDKGLNLPIPQTPTKPVGKPPIENIITLLEHIIKVRRRKKPLQDKLLLLTDKNSYDEKTVDEIEKIEEEIEFINKYTLNLENQAVVIMNEHNVTGIPLLEDLEKTIPVIEEDDRHKNAMFYKQ